MDFSLAILCLLAVALSGVLLALPSTRRYWGDLAMAFKTVPCGCLTALLVPSLLYYLPWLFIHTAVGNLLTCLLGIALAIVVIYFLVKLLRKIFKIERTYSSAAFVCLFIVLAMFLLPASCVLDAVRPDLPWEQKQEPFRKGPWITFQLPTEPDGTRIRFQQRTIHAFLAEYDYRFILQRGKEQKTYYLFPNLGGRTAINLYRLADGRLLYEDKDGRYLIDPASLTVGKLAVGLPPDGDEPALYYATLPKDQTFHGGTGPYQPREDGTALFVMEFDTDQTGTQFVPATPIPDKLLATRKFYGCIAWGDRDGRPDGFSSATRSQPFLFEFRTW